MLQIKLEDHLLKITIHGQNSGLFFFPIHKEILTSNSIYSRKNFSWKLKIKQLRNRMVWCFPWPTTWFRLRHWKTISGYCGLKVQKSDLHENQNCAFHPLKTMDLADGLNVWVIVSIPIWLIIHVPNI